MWPWLNTYKLGGNVAVGNVRLLLFCSPARQQISWATANAYCSAMGYRIAQLTTPALANAMMQLSASNQDDWSTNGCHCKSKSCSN